MKKSTLKDPIVIHEGNYFQLSGYGDKKHVYPVLLMTSKDALEQGLGIGLVESGTNTLIDYTMLYTGLIDVITLWRATEMLSNYTGEYFPQILLTAIEYATRSKTGTSYNLLSSTKRNRGLRILQGPRPL